jgi:hypothetical protein
MPVRPKRRLTGAWRTRAECVSRGLDGCWALFSDIAESRALRWQEPVDQVWVTRG